MRVIRSTPILFLLVILLLLSFVAIVLSFLVLPLPLILVLVVTLPMIRLPRRSGFPGPVLSLRSIVVIGGSYMALLNGALISD